MKTTSTLERKTALRIVKALNLVMMTMSFAFIWYTFYAKNIRSPFYNKGNWLVIAIFTIVYSMYGRVYDAFKVSLYRISEMVYSQILAAFLSDIVLYIIIWLLTVVRPPIWPSLLCLGLQVLIATVWCYCSHRWYFKTFPARKSAIIYGNRPGMEQLIHEYGLSKKFDVVKIEHVQNCLNNMEILDDIDAVFLCGIHSHERNILLKYCIA